MPIAWNAYAYARDNPTSFVDPTGHQWWKWVLAGLAIVALAVLSVVTYGAATPLLVTVIVGVVAGGVVGGIAEGASFQRLLLRVAEGALLGAAIGAALGALSGGLKSGLIERPQAPERTLGNNARQWLDGPCNARAAVPPPSGTPGAAAAPAAPVTAQELGKAAINQLVGGPAKEWLIYGAARFAYILPAQTALVDLTAGVTGAWHDEIGAYLRRQGVNLGFLTDPLPP